MAVRAWPVHSSSLWPQLMLIAVGVGAWAAVRHRVEESLVGVGREVDDDVGARRERTGDLDVEQHLAVGPVRVLARHVRRAVDADGGHRRAGLTPSPVK